MAARTASGSARRAISIAGSSTGSAPSARSASARLEACRRVRVTSTRQPASGRRNAGARRSRSATTSPTTSSAGGCTPASRAAAAISASGASTTRWRGVVASTISALGVEGGRPPSISARAMPSRRPTPISTTSVSAAVASSAQRTCAAGLAGSSWPVTTAKLAATPRCVTGMPAAATPPIAEVTPGTTVASRPASASASSSSPPASEDERVAALEAHDALARARVLDERGVDLLLRHRHAARRLADVDALRVIGAGVEQRRRGEAVVEHDLGLAQRLQAALRHEPRIARPRADEPDVAGLGLRRAHCGSSPAAEAAPSCAARPRPSSSAASTGPAASPKRAPSPASSPIIARRASRPSATCA